MALPKVHFLTFAAGKRCWMRSAERLRLQSAGLENIHHRAIVTPKNLSAFTGSRTAAISEMAESNPRGFGLWSWKIPLLTCALKELPKGDVLMYLDAGSTLNITKGSKGRFKDYLEMAQDRGGLFFQQDLLEHAWSKQEMR